MHMHLHTHTHIRARAHTRAHTHTHAHIRTPQGHLCVHEAPGQCEDPNPKKVPPLLWKFIQMFHSNVLLHECEDPNPNKVPPFLWKFIQTFHSNVLLHECEDPNPNQVPPAPRARTRGPENTENPPFLRKFIKASCARTPTPTRHRTLGFAAAVIGHFGVLAWTLVRSI